MGGHIKVHQGLESPSLCKGPLPSWDLQVAAENAQMQGIVLTSAHFEILELARSFFVQYGFSPSSRPLSKYISEKKGLEKGRSIYLLRLFPQQPAILIAKIAGLPKPKNCL
ncbi:MAG: hypothetical protein CBC09_09355 [Cellvibrionales bacterium TMED49]|nr:sulfurtransferase TusE [Porticoccaceae bacterium]OUU35245.1 MAG: hypothetical protein CBC09_09355 [Cellvibrionales bacterium TMED49]